MTVSYVEGHGSEVRIMISELGFIQTHGVGSGIRATHCGRTTEREVSLGVQRVGDNHIIAGHTVQLAVVVHRVFRTLDSHHHRISCCDAEDTRLGSHRIIRIRSGLCRHGNRILTNTLTSFTTQGVNRSNTISRNSCNGSRQFRIGSSIVVIYLALVISLNGDSSRRYCLVTIGHFKGHRAKVCIGVGELTGSQAHRCGTHLSSRSASRTAEGVVNHIATYFIQ